MITPTYEWQAFHDIRLQFAIKLANLLSSCRSYLDQTEKRLKYIQPNHNDQKYFKIDRSSQYDNVFGYRFMEALRNYSQHRGLPLHGSSYGVKRKDENSLQYSVATSINTDQLRSDTTFKPEIANEIQAAKIPVEPLVRDYLAGLSAVHTAMRQRLRERTSGWIKIISGAITEYIENTPDHKLTPGLCAGQIGKSGEIVQSVHLGEDISSRIAILQKRHGSLEQLPKSFVSGVHHEKTFDRGPRA